MIDVPNMTYLAMKTAQMSCLGISSLVLMGRAAIAQALPTPVTTPPAPIPITQQVQEVVSYLVGILDLVAGPDPQPPSVQMRTCEVQMVGGPSGEPLPTAAATVFLYQEQAHSDRLSQPYRQRFLQIAPSSDGQQVESRGFRPLTPELWINLCERPVAERLVQPTDISAIDCSVFLRRVGEDYIGHTQANGCPSTYRGAVRTTNHIILNRLGMETHDRGFDAAGHQVWGSTGEPYRFVRR